MDTNLKVEFIREARALGFSGVYVMRPERLSHWMDFLDANPRYRRGKFTGDPLEIMPDCQSVILLVYPYVPYAPGPALPSAYYVASQQGWDGARQVAKWLQARGYKAVDDPPIAHKALAERMGAGRYGRNGIIAAGEHGSRVALEVLLCDAIMEPDPLAEGHGFSDECANCRSCVSACPTGALAGDGLVDYKRCLRAQSNLRPFPEEWRHLIGASLLGCDLCQDHCPRNRALGTVPAPEELLADFSLEMLLRGEMTGAAKWVGANYARKKRLQARACMVAANIGRADLLDSIRPLMDDDSAILRDAARWALRVLSGEE